MGTRALIYTRVSHDRAGGRSPAEQEAESRAQCEHEGWDVAEVVTDSVGASRHSKGTRNGWSRARQLVASGAVDVLVTWEASRAQRDLAAYAELRDLCVSHGVRWAYSGRVHDMTTSDGRFRTGLDALLAEREADEIAERVQRAMRANAAAGRPHGRRLFGYQRIYDATSGALTGQEPHPGEAPAVARMFSDYLAGKGIRTLAAELNAEGITTGTGARWSDTQVRRVLVNPAYVARRVHRGEVIREAEWAPLVDDDTFERVQARMESRRHVRQASTARLLTGVARCGVCGAKLAVGKDRHGRRYYQCRGDRGQGPKFCVGRDLVKLDAYITAVVLERLAQPDVADALDGTEDPAVAAAQARVIELQARLDDALARFVAGDISGALLARAEAELKPKITEAEREARRTRVPLDLDVPSKGIDTWWDGLDSSLRREVVAALVATVTVHPVGIGRRRFDPSAITVIWR
jgi:site-specific DNA recombinase